MVHMFRKLSAFIISAAFSAIMIVGAFVFPDGMYGILQLSERREKICIKLCKIDE